MATALDLTRKILKQLGVWQAGQDLPPEDVSAVMDELPSRLLAMSRLHIYDTSAEYIADEAVDMVADYLANKYAGAFGITGDELAKVEVRGDRAERDLRYLRSMGPTYAPVRAEYF